MAGLAVLCAPCAAAAAGFQEQEPEPSQVARDAAALEARGWIQFEKGELDNAMDLFQRALEADRWQAWRGVAEVRRQRGEQDEARRAFGRLLEADPADDAVRLEYALLCSWTGRYAEAEEHLARVEQGAEDPELRERARLARADNAAWGGDHRDAWDRYRGELEMRPDDAAMLVGLGELELWKGRAGHARKHFLNALERQPSSDRARAGLAAADALLAPEFLVQVQYLRDNAGWSRLKTLTGAEFSPDLDDYPGWRMFLGTEYAAFEDDSGADLERDSVVTRQILRPDPFTRVHLDFEFGDHRDETTVRAGVEAQHEAAADTYLWGGWRHDDFINAHAPYPFDRYNQALVVDLARGDVVQADTLQLGGAYDPAAGWGGIVNLLAGTIEGGNARTEAYLQGHHRTREGGESVTWRGFLHWMDYQDPSVLYYAPASRDSVGGGWRWERREDDWTAYLDLSAFWESASTDGLGWQAGAGWNTEWQPGASAGVELHYLSSDDGRTGADRYASWAVLLHVTYDF